MLALLILWIAVGIASPAPAPKAKAAAPKPEDPAGNSADAGFSPGRYRTTIFDWDTLLTIDRVDDKGQLHGKLTSCPNQIRRKYGIDCSTVDFETEAGPDGLAQRVNPKPLADYTSAGNDYTRMRACESDVCARASRLVGREDRQGDELAEVEVRFVKQTADAPSADPARPASPEPLPLPSPSPSGRRPGARPPSPILPGLPAGRQ